MENDENFEQSLAREIKEETDLNLVKNYLYKCLLMNNKIYLIYLCEVEGEKIKLSDEHTDYRWVTFEQFRKVLKVDIENDLKNLSNFIEKLIE